MLESLSKSPKIDLQESLSKSLSQTFSKILFKHHEISYKNHLNLYPTSQQGGRTSGVLFQQKTFAPLCHPGSRPAIVLEDFAPANVRSVGLFFFLLSRWVLYVWRCFVVVFSIGFCKCFSYPQHDFCCSWYFCFCCSNNPLWFQIMGIFPNGLRFFFNGINLLM